ncbi:MAG: alpha/beta hydrolase [Chloroflexaceae bacterium]|nr:alpha/beta hydrolase [Chloroflexaceae bacterium]
MGTYAYTLRRMYNALLLPYLQRTPHSGPTEAITIQTSDGVPLAAMLLPRGKPDLLVICHGFAASKHYMGIVWLAEALVGEWDVLTFDWRGYGESGGRASLGGDEAHDLIAVLRYARERGYRHVGLIAESMGGLIALHTIGTAMQQGLPYPDFPYPERMATLAAPADLALTTGPRPLLVEHLAPQTWAHPVTRLMGFKMGRPNIARPLDVVSAIRIPLLVLHGDADTTVLVANAYAIKQRNPQARLKIYPGVDHGVTFMRSHVGRELVQDLTDFFHAMPTDTLPSLPLPLELAPPLASELPI